MKKKLTKKQKQEMKSVLPTLFQVLNAAWFKKETKKQKMKIDPCALGNFIKDLYA